MTDQIQPIAKIQLKITRVMDELHENDIEIKDSSLLVCRSIKEYLTLLTLRQTEQKNMFKEIQTTLKGLWVSNEVLNATKTDS